MQKFFLRLWFIGVVACMAQRTLQVATQAQQQPAAPSSTKACSLQKFLQNYLRILSSSDDDKTTRYFNAFVDLNDDGIPEVIVYVTGQTWCGSGGCMTLVLVGKDCSSRVVTKISITRPPIRILTDASNGWRNIGVWVQGGGIQPGYEAELPFDGQTYPTNPSTPPARRLTRKIAGEVVVPASEHGTLLYR
jgi:hypothetical protein